MTYLSRLEICAFTGYKIHPGHGILYVRTDNRSFRLLSSKAASLFLQRKNPRKIHWTVVFRRMHRKGIVEEAAKKRTRRAVKHQRAIAGITMDAIKAKRNQKPEVRAAARVEAVKKAKADKAEKAKKKAAEKASRPAQAGGAKISKQQQKGARPAVAAKSR
ncbi:ribosomal protein L24e-domain-containing protein [Syncephalis plumigaleata]|nr:ribosomal protein L24e-domain-containing protein [Syncephalis plumigaleata]